MPCLLVLLAVGHRHCLIQPVDLAVHVYGRVRLPVV
jgi:hypothetical protein